jgi:hypothetical protein
MGKTGFDCLVTVLSNWGLIFVFNKTPMGGGSMAEGHRQWVARETKTSTTKDTKEHKETDDLLFQSEQ